MTPPLVDDVGLPVAVALLGCFRTQLNRLTKVPATIGLRAGNAVDALIGLDGTDECLCGVAWVRISGGPFPSWEGFPAPTTTPMRCPPFAYGVELELGVVRCAPWEGEIQGVPSQEQWDTLAIDLANDDRAMRSAIRCCFPMAPSPEVPYAPIIYVMGTYVPRAVTGGCAGGTRTVTVQVIPGCEDC